MKIVVHYPQTQEDIKNLTGKAADVHSGAIENYIKNLPCPKEQKVEILIQTIKMLNYRLPIKPQNPCSI